METKKILGSGDVFAQGKKSLHCGTGWQRWALPIELRYSDIPIAIGLRINNRNIGLAMLSDFKDQTSKTGLPIVR